MSYDEARMSGPHFMSGGTAYMLDTTGYAGVWTTTLAADDELARHYHAANIWRCCDGDDKRAMGALPDRHTMTLEMAQQSYVKAAGVEPDLRPLAEFGVS